VFLALINGYLRWLCVAPLLWVGEISYSLYLIHQHIGFTIMLNADAAGWNPLLAYAAAVFAAFLLGWMLNRYVEKPSTRWILARWERFQLRRSAQRAAREQGAGHAGVDTFRDSL
jgi:peptidoglycan/LPS O-acetylase OafA/YrhL